MKTFIRHLKQFVIILITCYILVTVLNYSFSKYFDGYNFLVSFVYIFSITFSIYVANVLVFTNLFFRGKLSVQKKIIGLFITNVISILVRFFIDFFGYLFLRDLSFVEIIEKIKDNTFGFSVFSVVFTTIVYIVLLIRRKDKIEVKEQETIAIKATASFETLKNQLDPHFLFNSLNVLSALIEENPTKAQEFTIALSKIYRYVLDQKDKNLNSVEEELSFSKLYVSLLKMRFEDAINVNFPDEENLKELKIVPLSLQLLLENAVKHNIISESKPLEIAIFIEDDYLVVRNSFQKKKTLEQSSGIGLQNIVQRYQLVSQKVVEIFQNENYFQVKLPLITGETLYNHQEDLIEKTLFANAYKKMIQLKEFYVTLWFAIIGIPLLIILNILIYPEYKWSVAMCLFMLVALTINGIRTLSFFNKWEQKQLNKQLNKK